MQYYKTTYGMFREKHMYNVECLSFPSTHQNGSKSVKIKKYDQLFSIYVKKIDDQLVVKVINVNGEHMSLLTLPSRYKDFINNKLFDILNINNHLRLNQYQMFFGEYDGRIILVDVFDGEKFISPGMLKDIYSCVCDTQEIIDEGHNAITKSVFPINKNIAMGEAS